MTFMADLRKITLPPSLLTTCPCFSEGAALDGRGSPTNGQVGYIKVRHRGLVKNIGQIMTLFAPANPWPTLKPILPLPSEVCP
jgi:hypothetical protein